MGITFIIQFFQVQLNWSRRNLSLPTEQLSLVLCKFNSARPSLFALILVFFSIFKLIVFSMLNENFFYKNAFTKIIEHVEPKVFKLGCR